MNADHDMKKKQRTVVRMFQPRFAGKVAAGEKRQTVRPWPKPGAVFPQVGDLLSAREWLGKPYRSKQRILMTAPVVNVHTVRIEPDRLILDENVYCVPTDLTRFARADGFEDWPDLLEWFEAVHELPFSGIAIFW